MNAPGLARTDGHREAVEVVHRRPSRGHDPDEGAVLSFFLTPLPFIIIIWETHVGARNGSAEWGRSPLVIVVRYEFECDTCHFSEYHNY